jgi:cytochrome oxidase Cu insertion factor (SCO1/SenC/PrrC family)
VNETGAVPEVGAEPRPAGGPAAGSADPAPSNVDPAPEIVDPAPSRTAPQPARPRTRRSTIRFAAIALVSGLVFATAFAFAVTRLSARNSAQPIRPTGIPASVSNNLAALMQLSPVPVSPAPGFTLTDQSGKPISLAGFRGHTVVLTFMDSHCTDICPLVSREFIDASKDLGRTARNVVFIAVNVNPYHRAITDVASYSRAQRLDSIRSWHFVTGSVRSLRTVWANYQVEVRAPSRNADVIHTSLIYFIDPKGKERYVAAPTVDHTAKGAAFLPPGQLASWGRGIALVARAVNAAP